MSFGGEGEDEEFPDESGGEWDSGEGSQENGRGKGEERIGFAEPVEVSDRLAIAVDADLCRV